MRRPGLLCGSFLGFQARTKSSPQMTQSLTGETPQRNNRLAQTRLSCARAVLGYEPVVALGTKPLATVRECLGTLRTAFRAQFPTADDARLLRPTTRSKLVTRVIFYREIEADTSYLGVDQNIQRPPIAANPGEPTQLNSFCCHVL